MNHVAQGAETPLKYSGVIENRQRENGIINKWVEISGDGQTSLLRGNRLHTDMSRLLSVSRAPHFRVNLEDHYLYRHWSPGSQIFVGGDTLLTALDSGWKIADSVLRQAHSCINNRCTYVYHLELHQDGQCSSMKVVENPWVARLLHQLQVEIVSKISPEF